MKHFSTALSGLLALTVYCILVALVVFYFNTRYEERAKHFVKKDEHRIRVALRTPEKMILPRHKVSHIKKPKKLKKKEKPKSKRNPKKRIVKEKLVKKRVVKKRDHNRTRPQRRTKDLFKNIKIAKKKKLKIEISDTPLKAHPKHTIIKVSSQSASARIAKVLQSRKKRDSGVENAYFAKVQRMLEEWPAQSDYAGEKAKVILYIKPSGAFTFKLLSHSNIPAFNEGLEAFLEQLQMTGFGRHHAGRTYQFEAEFIAKD